MTIDDLTDVQFFLFTLLSVGALNFAVFCLKLAKDAHDAQRRRQ